VLEEANHSRTQKIQFTVIKRSDVFFFCTEAITRVPNANLKLNTTQIGILVYFQLIVTKKISSRIICKVLAVRAIESKCVTWFSTL
jgi:hypothetical protein